LFRQSYAQAPRVIRQTSFGRANST
jgi:hypothetical protein